MSEKQSTQPRVNPVKRTLYYLLCRMDRAVLDEHKPDPRDAPQYDDHTAHIQQQYADARHDAMVKNPEMRGAK